MFIEEVDKDSIVKDFGQWLVFKWGIGGVNSNGFIYEIVKERINDPDWHSHMKEKNWLDEQSFLEAMQFAKNFFKKELKLNE